MDRNREHAGIPTGGRFAAESRPEADIDLDVTPDASEIVDRWFDGERVNIGGALESQHPDLDREVVRVDFARRIESLPNAPESREQAHDILAELDEYARREQGWKDSGFVEPGISRGPDGRDQLGSKYVPGRDIVETKKAVLEDLKRARSAGYLPPHVTFGARTSRFSGGRALNIAVKGLSDEEIFAPEDENTLAFGRVRSRRARQVVRRIEALIGDHNVDRSRTERDYFDVDFYAQVSLESEADRAYAERVKARKSGR